MGDTENDIKTDIASTLKVLMRGLFVKEMLL